MTNSDYGFGVSFMPNGDARYQRPESGAVGQNAGIAPIQDAIKVLSMRVPRVVGANPLAPLALLQSRGGGGLPPGIVEQLMRTMGQMPATNQGGPMQGQMGGVGLTGATSPFLNAEPSRPQGFGQAPLPSVTVGATGTPLPPPEAGPPPAPPQTPLTQGQQLWDLAQRQRGSMGRTSY